MPVSWPGDRRGSLGGAAGGGTSGPVRLVSAPIAPTAPALPPTTPTVSATAWLESTQLMHHWTSQIQLIAGPRRALQIGTCRRPAEAPPERHLAYRSRLRKGSAKPVVAPGLAERGGWRFATHTGRLRSSR